ncbi:hypothetical protein D7294_09075 [Streptomyces hoynatensis]|uniref:Uncharacterized protein n=1 Tax=Streptomyces hoynatensis TaxID=1141874 RepID=A0A3A9Z648_9ACTN|nr:hypothetical protein D7294_09075 [Streptomyces hoynatensis]
MRGLRCGTAWYRYVANETGATVGYLRVLVVRLTGGAVSFLLGIGRSPAERRLIDDCLESVEPLAS